MIFGQRQPQFDHVLWTKAIAPWKRVITIQSHSVDKGDCFWTRAFGPWTGVTMIRLHSLDKASCPLERAIVIWSIHGQG
jgi:hypothetical protein